ncbi:hypothetical protein EYS42_16730 [Aquabacterium lacunae]|uniref:Uncharacterized protein n=1 Tax=Aquabacterium lacunae TaxID=2528630 RepID=A0A4Q9H0R4_9BURK|nr:hypothetical protein [Aquabacterium lacunae]TBO27481.1 hypothetical protein EYS42_16730 [Aquabacterium lacunae]
MASVGALHSLRSFRRRLPWALGNTKMRVHIPPSLPLAFLAIWAIACIFAFLFASVSPVFEFAYFVLPFSAFVVPLCVSHLSCRLANVVQSEPTESKRSIALSAAAAAIGVVAYGLSFSVIARFLELPWRAGKFGEASLDLGMSAAQSYGLAAILTALAAFALLKASPTNSRYAIGSLGMLTVASLIYLLLGLTPLVQWRA